MDALGTGLILILNGLLALGEQLLGWYTLLLVVLGLSLMYLATLEISELDRTSAKPTVDRH